MIVVVEAGLFQRPRLMRLQHAERDTGFQPFCLHGLDHGRHLGQVAVLQFTPGGAHAEAICPAGLRLAGSLDDLLERHEFFGLQAGVEMR